MHFHFMVDTKSSCAVRNAENSGPRGFSRGPTGDLRTPCLPSTYVLSFCEWVNRYCYEPLQHLPLFSHQYTSVNTDVSVVKQRLF